MRSSRSSRSVGHGAALGNDGLANRLAAFGPHQDRRLFRYAAHEDLSRIIFPWARGVTHRTLRAFLCASGTGRLTERQVASAPAGRIDATTGGFAASI